MNPAQRMLERQRLKNLGQKPDAFKAKPKSNQAGKVGTVELQKQVQVGSFDGLCNRTACRRPFARWWNRGSYAHYCTPCAEHLNRCNARDAEELLGAGEKLCILVETAEHHPLSVKYDYPKTGTAGFRY